jgi:transcriptional regulator with XRE-family HTH domain
MERGNDWSVRVARDIGKRVKHYRGRADLTASMLSERCGQLGLPIDRNVIAKLENGHRNSVTVDEVCVVAAALGVPPVLLLFDVAGGGLAEVLPGRHVPAFRAEEWFAGSEPLPGPGDAGAVTVTDLPNAGAALPLVIYRLSDQAYREQRQAQRRARLWEEQGDAAGAEMNRRDADQALTARLNLRREAEARGIHPPESDMSLRPPGDALIG